MMQDTKELTSFSEVNNGFDPINQIKGLPYISLDSKNIFGSENTISEKYLNKDKLIFSIIKESKKTTKEKSLFNTDNSQESIPKKDEEKPKIPKFISFNEIKKKFGNTLNEISKDFFNVDQSSLLKAENELQSYTIKKINISDDFNNSQDKEEQKDISILIQKKNLD
jgi:lipase chaperone LimK